MTGYSLPFAQGAKLIELGGGAAPIVRPNCDVRMCQDANGNQMVDFTADFEKPLPIQSEEWDGVISKFSMEHVSWRTVRGLIKEIYRILKPGGTAVVIIPNLLEQARSLVEKGDSGEWDDNASCLIFGDLDYPENSHKCGFSPEYAGRLFREAGFAVVLVLPFGDNALKTDMVVEARR